jgi:hypothetical protein
MSDELTPAEEARLAAVLHRIAAETPPAAPAAPAVPSTSTAPAASASPSGRRRRPALGLVAAGVAAAAVLAAGLAVAQLGGSDHRDQAGRPTPRATSGSSGPQLGFGVPYDLDRLVRESDHVVIGRVTEVRRGSGEEAGGLPYVLAHIDSEEVLRGGGGDVWAFDYDLGAGTNGAGTTGAGTTGAGTSSVPAGAPWRVGDRLLLFLTSPAGTVHERVQPPHLQVVAGAQGRYVVNGDAVEAPFSLADVRAAVAESS